MEKQRSGIPGMVNVARAQAAARNRKLLGYPDDVRPENRERVEALTNEVRGNVRGAILRFGLQLAAAGVAIFALPTLNRQESNGLNQNVPPVSQPARPRVEAGGSPLSRHFEARRASIKTHMHDNLAERLKIAGHSEEQVREILAQFYDPDYTKNGLKMTNPNVEAAETFTMNSLLLSEDADTEATQGLHKFFREHGHLLNVKVNKDGEFEYEENTQLKQQPRDFGVKVVPIMEGELNWFINHTLPYFDENNRSLTLIRYALNFLGGKEKLEISDEQILGLKIAVNDAKIWSEKGKLDYGDDSIFKLGGTTKAQTRQQLKKYLPLLKPDMTDEQLAKITMDYIATSSTQLTSFDVEFLAYQFLRQALASGEENIAPYRESMMRLVKDPSKIVAGGLSGN